VTEVTEWIRRARAGDADAGERLYRAIYDDLRRIAQRALRGAGPGGASATSLVHEAWLRLSRDASIEIADRRHFYATAARAMRQLIVDRARTRGRHKRGGEYEHLALDEAIDGAPEADRAEQALADVAALGGRSERSLKRDWRKARAFLHAELMEGSGDEPRSESMAEGVEPPR
jgi:RNA polymerase sigma factor (TIGR02999 family)